MRIFNSIFIHELNWLLSYLLFTSKCKSHVTQCVNSIKGSVMFWDLRGGILRNKFLWFILNRLNKSFSDWFLRFYSLNSDDLRFILLKLLFSCCHFINSFLSHQSFNMISQTFIHLDIIKDIQIKMSNILNYDWRFFYLRSFSGVKLRFFLFLFDVFMTLISTFLFWFL